MIQTNLSTRPFYNEGAVRMALLALAIVVALFTVFNVTRVVQLSRRGGGASSQAARDESQAADLRHQASQLRAKIDPKQIELVTNEAHKANDLIDRRTFSWTELFNRFETTLPEDVRITSVRPKVDTTKGTTITITVVARTIEDVYQFILNLQDTGAFSNLIPRDDRFNDQGLVETIIEGRYAPSHAPGGGGATP
jgi:Tfp pilus assembly protein PilN